MSAASEPVDLANCDREPIHIPGSIQPHGVLLALTAPDLRIVQASDNVRSLLDRPTEQVLGKRLGELFEPDAAAAVSAALAADDPSDANPIGFSLPRGRHSGIVHRHDGVGILELEPQLEDALGLLGSAPLQKVLAGLQQVDRLDGLGEIIVEATRRLIGFERVMLYRFDEEGHGSVDAESKDGHLEPYLGLHYPASDIPRQARQLYLRNWLRIIPDARYEPVPVLPSLNPETGRPLDLSFAVLRSVSPIHLEYLANMGVRASMSISLVVRGRLWGLVSCANHSGPRFVSYEARTACEAMGRLASIQIAALEEQERTALRQTRRGDLEALAAAMATTREDEDVLEGMLRRPEALLSLVAASGAAIACDSVIRTCGATPPPSFIRDLAAWLDRRGESGPFATDALTGQFPQAAGVKDSAAGVLTIAVPGSPRRRVLWFRPEQVQSVFWGGDPQKAIEVAPGTRLHPRRSFAKWREEVRLRAHPWKPGDRDVAEELRRRTVEIDLDRQLTRAKRAVRARDDLVAVVSHDLRNPLNVIRMQTSSLLRATSADRPQKDDAGDRLTRAAERIQGAVDRMSALVSDLLDLAKIEAGRFEVKPAREALGDVLDEAIEDLRPLAEAKNIALVIEHADPAIARIDRERMFQVLSNILGNAIKFTPNGGRITVDARRIDGEIWVSTADTGPGLPEEALPRVFDRYWQDADRAPRAGGSGLGLYIAKGIVEAHGGRIWAERAERSGAKFTFALPCAE